MTDLTTRITFTPVIPEDFAKLVDLRVAAMREGLEHLGRFNPERARERLRKSFYPEHTRYIVFDGQKVGFYTFRPFGDALYLDHLYVLPGHQSLGIGSHVMRKLIAEADARRQPIHVGALKGSASNRFYQRHGFKIEREEDWDIYYVRPAADGVGSEL